MCGKDLGRDKGLLGRGERKGDDVAGGGEGGTGLERKREGKEKGGEECVDRQAAGGRLGGKRVGGRVRGGICGGGEGCG